jgi:aminopeptidase-like protein
VMGYAKSFKGTVDLGELKKHLTYRKDWPNALGYHCDYYYKPWLSNWGFSIPYSVYEKLEEGEYEIDLETAFSDRTMKVCDYHLEGETEETIILNAHNCHAAQANDDIAGVVVAVEVMKRIRKQKRKYSYRLIVCPEHLGTVFYLAGLSQEQVVNFKYCIFLEALGNNNRFALQESFTGDSILDRAFHHYLADKHPEYFSNRFRTIIGNDETVWESPGFEIPTVSISRFPFPEYHTSMDNENIILYEKLEESVDMLLDVLTILESNCRMKRNFNGLVALSNPKYDLYISPGTDPSIPSYSNVVNKKWNNLMDCLPRYFDKKTTVLEIAIKHDLPFHEVRRYIHKFEEKGLVKII